MRTGIRAVSAVILSLGLLLAPGVKTAHAGAGGVPGPIAAQPDSGCSLYLSIPNPCDPEGNN